MEADVHPGMSGPVVECVPYGQARNGMIEREIDVTKALSLVLKLEEISIKISEDGPLHNKISNLYNFYKDNGAEEDAERFANALEYMSEGKVAIDTLKENMKTTIENEGKLTVESLYSFKSMSREIIDGVFNKITYAMLGVDVAALEVEVLSEDCGYDHLCFEEKFHNCAVGSSFSPDEFITLSIVELNDAGQCTIDLSFDTGEQVSCLFETTDYKYRPLAEESFKEVCGEELRTVLEEMESRYGPGEGEGPDGPEYHSECGDGVCDDDEIGYCFDDCDEGSGYDDYYEYEDEYSDDDSQDVDETTEEAVEETTEEEPAEEETVEETVEETTEEETVEETTEEVV